MRIKKSSFYFTLFAFRKNGFIKFGKRAQNQLRVFVRKSFFLIVRQFDFGSPDRQAFGRVGIFTGKNDFLHLSLEKERILEARRSEMRRGRRKAKEGKSNYRSAESARLKPSFRLQKELPLKLNTLL